MTNELYDTISKLSKILHCGYVDEVRFDGNLVSTEDRDFCEHFEYNIKEQTFTFYVSSGLVDHVVKTVDGVRELISTEEDVIVYDECLRLISEEVIKGDY